MLNELKMLSDTLDSAGIHPQSVHSHLSRLNKSDPVFRVYVGECGQIKSVSCVSDEDRRLLYKFASSFSSGSWPVMRIQYNWGIKDEKCFVRFQSIAKVLAEKVGKSPSSLSAFNDLNERTALLCFKDVQDKVSVHAGELKKFLLAFEVAETDKKCVCHPDCYSWLNKKLLEPEFVSRKEATGVDAYGVPLVGNEDQPMPVVNLPCLGLTKLRAMNVDCPAFEKYGKSGGDTFVVSTTLRQKFKNALEYITATEEGHKGYGSTWSAIDVGDESGLFIAYPTSMPDVPMDLHEWNVKLDEELGFKASTSKVIDSLRRIKEIDTTAVINTFALLPNQQSSKRVSMTGQYSIDRLIASIEDWDKGIDNTPEVRGYKAAVLPFQLSKDSRKEWRRDLQFKLHANGLTASECFELFLGSPHSQNKVAQKGIRLYGRRWKNFAMAPVPEQTKKGIFGIPGIFWNKHNRFPATLGILLHKSGVDKMDYVKSYPFLCGQLVQVYDSLHRAYCQIERAGSHPAQYMGSSFVRSICGSNPQKGYKNLMTRAMFCYAWAKSDKTNSKYEEMKLKAKDEYVGPPPGVYRGQIDRIKNQLHDMEQHMPEPRQFSDEEQVIFDLGYCCKITLPDTGEANEN